MDETKATDPATMGAIASLAQGSANLDIQYEGRQIAFAVQLAIAAAGDSDEPIRRLGMMEKGMRLQIACIKAGYRY